MHGKQPGPLPVPWLRKALLRQQPVTGQADVAVEGPGLDLTMKSVRETVLARQMP